MERGLVATSTAVEFSNLGWQAWYTGAVVVAMVVALVREWLGPPVILGVALAALLAAGVLTPGQALDGFSNQGLLTIAALFVVAQGVQESGGLVRIALTLLGNSRRHLTAVFRLMVPTVAVSAFLNNTPVVAMFVPVVRGWAIRHDIAPSRLLIPLSYASILGGMCTLVGTSTNLVVSGMMVDRGFEPIGMFEIGRAGLPIAIAGLAFMLLAGRKLLPSRRDITDQLADERREYLLEMEVLPECALIGKSIEDAGLRHLKGLYLVHVERGDNVIGPVPPTYVLQAGDRLLFTGLVSTIVELKSIRGLAAVDETGTLDVRRHGGAGDLRLFEVVISPTSPLVGQGIRDAGFRNHYDAAVIAVHRAGARVESKIGDIVLRPGDTLLLEAPSGFARRWYNSVHFYLVSQVGDVRPVRHEKAPFVLVVLGVMIALPALELVPMVVSAIGAAAVFLVARIVPPESARRSIDLAVLVVIAAALGVGKALEITGLAAVLAGLVVDAVSALGPVAVLASVLVLTNLFTELVTNKAAAALFFPVALSAAQQAGADPRPFMIAVSVAAAASFATPLGYQTNLIVYGPGGYRYTDFLRVGVFMNLLAVTVAAFAITIGWNVG